MTHRVETTTYAAALALFEYPQRMPPFSEASRVLGELRVAGLISTQWVDNASGLLVSLTDAGRDALAQARTAV